MPAPTPRYHTRLAWRLGPVAIHSLWQADDHLLVVDNYLGCFEVYSRVYFHDLQALQVRRTPARALLVTAYCVVAALVAAIISAVWYFGEIDAMPVFYLAPALLLTLAGVVAARGPTCSLSLRTPIQSVEVGAVGHWRSYAKLRATLLARVAQFTGADPATLLPHDDDFYARLAAHRHSGPLPTLGAAGAPRPAAAATAAPVAPAPPKPCRTAWHRAFFILLLSNAALDIPGFLLRNNTIYDTFEVLLLLACLVCVIVALVRQHRSDLIAPARRLPWLWLLFAGVELLAGLVVTVYIAVNEGVDSLSDLSVWDHPSLLVLNCADLLGTLVIGLLGLFALAAYHRSRPTPAAPTAPAKPLTAPATPPPPPPA